MLYSFAEWWHLLSLDAPTIALLWSWLFARIVHLQTPARGILLLATATWLLYVADRILDGLGRRQTELRERHIFHARHRRAFVIIALILAVPMVWMVFTRMYPRAVQDNLFLSALTLLYFFFVHGESRFGRVTLSGWLPKELAVGIIFAAATAVPSWSRISDYPDAAKARLAQAVVLFAVLCWVNCVAIEKWEAGWPVSLENSADAVTHRSTRWAGVHLRWIVLAIAIFSVGGAWLARTSGLGEIYLAALLSSGLFLALDARRSFLSPLCLRIAADAALLTPLAIFPLLKK